MELRPAANTAAADRNTAVTVILSGKPAPASASRLAVYPARGGRKAGSYVVTDSLLRFTPGSAFRPGELVWVTVPRTIQSLGGSSIRPFTYPFTTAVGGMGRGNFQPGTELSRPGLGAGLALGDVDGDGDLDLLTSNTATNTVDILLNGGNASGSTTGLFSNGSSVPVSGRPGTLALGDVDADGDLDLLAATSNGTVSIRLNGGDASGSNTGVFSGNHSVAIRGTAQALVVGDVDGDGDLDLLTASATDGQLSVRLNGGNASGSNTGIFSGTQAFAVAAETSALALADIDGDGDLDVLGTSANGNTINFALNGGDASGSNTGLFLAGQSVPVGLRPAALALADLNGDGTPDLVSANAGSGTVSIRLNGGNGNPAGSFGGAQEVAVGPTPGAVLLADVDADGDLDLVVTDTSPGPGGPGSQVTVRLNGGDGSGSNTGIFGNGYTSAVGLGPAVLALGDIDGDLDLDLLTASPGTGTASIRLNLPPTPLISSFAPTSAVAGSTVTLVGDFLTGATVTVGGVAATVLNNSGTRLTFVVPAGASPGPVVVTNVFGSSSSTAFTVLLRVTATAPGPNALNVPRSGSSVRVSFTEPLRAAPAPPLPVFSAQAGGRKAGTVSVQGNTASFAPATGFLPGEVVSVTVPAQVLSAGGLGATPRVLQFTTETGGTGQANFQPGADPIVGSPSPYQVALADVDADGDLDLITAFSRAGSGGSLSVLRNAGQGTFSGLPEFFEVGGNTPDVRGVTAGDVDGDGDLDLVTANFGRSDVTTLLNDGTGRFFPQTIAPVGGSPYRLALADIDGDGDLDLLTANFGPNNLGNTVSVRLNDGRGTFRGITELPLGASISGLAVADVDNDGDLDLVASVFGEDRVAIRLNDGTGTFSGTASVAVGPGPYSVALADVNADGFVDLLTANLGGLAAGTTASVRLNDGRGAFGGGSEVGVGTAASTVLAADVDGDGDLDLLTANYGSNTVSVRLNNGQGLFGGGSDPTVDTGTYTRAGSFSLAVGDLDGDGDLDLAVANSGNSTSSTVSIRFNQPAPPVVLGFTPPSGGAGTVVTITGANFTKTTAVAFNGVVAAFTLVSGTQLTATVPATASTGPITVTSPAGSGRSPQNFEVVGSFTLSSVLPVRNQRNAPLASPVVFQFNQSISSTSAATALSVVSAQAGGYKSGTLTVSGNQLSFVPTVPFRPGETVTASLTAAVQSTGGQTMSAGHVFQFTAAAGAASGRFPALTKVASVGLNPLAAAVADLNGDGTLDVVTLNTGGRSFSVRFNDGSGQFSGTTNLSVGSGMLAFAVLDIDKDGDLDLLTTDGRLLVLKINSGTGTFVDGGFRPIQTTITDQIYSLVVGDVNADGYPDLLLPDGINSAVWVLLNNRAGGFTNRGTFGVGNGQQYFSQPYQLALADVDADGDLDCISLNSNPNGLVVRLNDGTGQFSGTYHMALNGGGSLAVADVNGDNVPDALVGANNTVQTLLGTGQGTFTVGSSVSVGNFPRTMATGDVDGDGDLDLVTSNSDGYSLSVRLNDGTGRFGGTANLATDQNPIGVVLADLDGDLDLDLLMCQSTDSNVRISLNPGVITTTTTAPDFTAAVRLFPNPASQRFSLMLPARPQPASLRLTLRNNLGQVVRSQQLQLPATETTAEVDAAGLAPGMYLLQGSIGSQGFSRRVVLQ
ncbi:VCBS repeat-containing protein [Hymenobacter sp. ISL-91]|uniref:FG-GAP-like repeat-containing protein n=1 Tax=Hymenobacter sp. ISL-91 TaxID=2819151 RepID=UPI001BE6B754|nr:FG-GAP-like repeat-containing protein [Hymenobacter sp. ISL-91]MBT2556854.1 VCBS repeat-containing protein [Hymenobacter sp. ISL-91]